MNSGDRSFAQGVDVLEEVIALDDVEDVFGDRHADGVTAEGAAVLAGDEEFCDFGFGEHGADGEPPTDGLAERHDIRVNWLAVGGFEMLVAEPLACASAACPDFVEDEGNAVLVAELADLVDVVWRKEIDAALSLDGFEDDAGGLGIDSGFKGINATGLDLLEAGDFGLEADADGGIACGGDHGEGPAVEASGEGDDLPAFWGGLIAAQASELASGFIGFQAAVTEEGLAFEGGAVESFGEFDLRLGVPGVTDVPETVHLSIGGIDEGWMAVTKNSPTEAGEEIEIVVAIGVPEIGALAASHDDGLARVVSDEDVIGLIDDFLGFGHWELG